MRPNQAIVIAVVTIPCLLSARVAGQTSTGPVLPSRESGNYSAYCSEEWTKRGNLNEEMYSYCLRRENDGYDQLESEVEKYKALPWLQGVVDHAIEQWSKHGTRRDEMVAYEVHRQIDAFLDIAYDSQQPNFEKQKIDACSERWSRKFIDWAMIEYCYKKTNE